MISCKFNLIPCPDEATESLNGLDLCLKHASWYSPENNWRITILELGMKMRGESPKTFEEAQQEQEKIDNLPKTLFEYEAMGHRFKRTKQEMKDNLTREQAFQARLFWARKNGKTEI